MQEKEFDAEDANLSQVIAFVSQILEEGDCPPKVQMQMEISIEEIFVNVAHYAYQNTESKKEKVRVLCSLVDDVLEMTFIDQGIPFDPLAKADPDTTLSADERQIGGLGIFMVKKYMDDMRYEYSGGENRLTMIKKLHA